MVTELNKRRGTGLYRKVAVATGIDVELPDMPDRGPNAWVTWDGDWAAFGGQEHTDYFELAEDSISLDPKEESIVIDPPLAPNATGVIPIKVGIENVSFAAYTCDDVVFQLSSTSHVTENGLITEHTALEYKSFALEVTGKGVMYFPKVRIKPGIPAGGIKELVSVTFEVQVFGTDDLPTGSGWQPFNEEPT